MLPTAPSFLSRFAFVFLVSYVCYEFAGLETGLAQGDAQASLTLVLAAIIAVSALVSTIAGFAFCALAGSAFAYLRVDPVEAVRTMVMCSTAVQLYAVWKIRDAIRWSSLRAMIAAGAATVPLGVWLLLHVDGAIYGVGLGGFLCARLVYGASP